MFSRTSLVCMLFVMILVTSASPVAASDLNAMLSLSLHMTGKDPSWRFDVSPCLWHYVLCNAAGNVTEIHWGSTWYPTGGLLLGGYANLTMLPQGLQVLDLNGNQLTGTPNLASLPQGLQKLFLDGNQRLTGTPNLASLPQGLQKLTLYGNNFTGNGTFIPSLPFPEGWCLNPQYNMCGASQYGVGRDGSFGCPAGTWHCQPDCTWNCPSGVARVGQAGGV